MWIGSGRPRENSIEDGGHGCSYSKTIEYVFGGRSTRGGGCCSIATQEHSTQIPTSIL